MTPLIYSFDSTVIRSSSNMLLIILFIVALTLYYYLKSRYNYWKKRGVPGPEPTFFFGNIGKGILLKKNISLIYSEIYNQYPDLPIVGIYRAFSPALLVRDPELIKDITIKYFNHFRDNDIELDKKTDPLFGRNPFCLKGDEWKVVRAQLTPGFTSGKMKWIYPHLEENSLLFVEFLEKQKNAFNGQGFEVKELCTRFTLENVACCAFGLKGKCFEDEKSEFRDLGERFTSPGAWALFVFFLLTLLPPLSKVLKIRFTPKDIEDKLTEIVAEIVKYREENNIVRNDFMHIISQLKKTCTDFEFTDVDVTAHAAAFFTDGYESSSTVMSFLMYHLADNPEVQATLREEVERAFAENNNKLPFEVLQDMPYLNGVVSESLRLHPVIFSLQKVCTKSYTFTPKETDQIKKPLLIEKDTAVIFPVHGLHKDPQYFEDPESFKPERFIGANKDNIVKCSYLPFGEGPRACLGQRFGLLQIKTGIAYMVKNYQMSVNKKTKLPIQYDPRNVLVSPLGGLWIDFKKIS